MMKCVLIIRFQLLNDSNWHLLVSPAELRDIAN